MPKGGNYNPTGKGGFKDNPQNINMGGKPKKQQLFSYWLAFFKDLSLNEFKDYTKHRKKGDMYVAEAIAYTRVQNSLKDLPEYKDLANRTEGMPKQTAEIKTDVTVYDALSKIGQDNPE